MQGGEVTGSIDEKVRHAVTKLSDLHLVSNSHAEDRVMRMGEAPDTVFVTGCPSIDLAARFQVEDTSGFDVYSVEGGNGVGHAFDPKNGYIIVMQHPVTTEHVEAADQAQTTMEAVLELGLPTFWFWPNVDAGSDATSKVLRQYRENNDPKNLYFLKNLSPENFLRLLKGARCMIGNSSAGIRECAYLGVPTVNIGTRQSGRERAENVTDVEYDKAAIVEAINRQMTHGPYASSDLYGGGEAGEKIAGHLASANLTCKKQISY